MKIHVRKKRMRSAPTTRLKSLPVIDVGVSCIHRDGKYLIAKQKLRKGGFWEFVGGKRESGEDIRAVIRREVQEELGVKVAVSAPFYITQTRVRGRRYRLHFCRSRIVAGRPKITEHEKLSWVDVEQLADYNFPAANFRAIPLLVKIEKRRKRKS